jgi:hypothetical protein
MELSVDGLTKSPHMHTAEGRMDRSKEDSELAGAALHTAEGRMDRSKEDSGAAFALF